MSIERKILTLEKAAVSDVGVLFGHGAHFDNEDDGGDTIVKGFFKPVLDDFLREGFVSWGHDWDNPIAMPTEAYEDEKGLVLGAKFHSDEQSQRYRTIAAERLAEGKTMGLSIGYEIAKEKRIGTSKRMLLQAKRLFEVGLVMVPMNRLALVSEVKKAIGPHDTPTSAEGWDGPANEGRLPLEAGAETYRRAYAWEDPDGDPDTKAAYRFMHHEISEDGDVGAANLIACSTGIGVLNGGRGGTTIPDADREGVYRHLAGHLRDAEREVPDLKALPAGLTYVDQSERVMLDLTAWRDRTRDLLTLDVEAKEGRAISSSRRDRLASQRDVLRSIADDLDALLAETAPPEKRAAFVLRARARMAIARAEYQFD